MFVCCFLILFCCHQFEVCIGGDSCVFFYILFCCIVDHKFLVMVSIDFAGVLGVADVGNAEVGGGVVWCFLLGRLLS